MARRLLIDRIFEHPWVKRIWDGPLAVPLRWVALFYRSLEQDRAFVRAGGMAYTTLLGTVPTAVLAVGIVGSLGIITPDELRVLAQESPLAQLPGALSALEPVLAGVDFGALGLVSTGGLLLVVLRLLLMVERAFSDVFGVPIQRPWPARIAVFTLVAVTAPVVIALSVRSVMAVQVLGSTGRTFLLMLAQYGAIYLAIQLFPSTRVQVRAAMIGAVVSLLLMTGGTRGFITYIGWFTSTEYPLRTFYGSLILVPAGLLWLYAFWVVLLLGVEVAYLAQFGRGLLAEEGRRDRQLGAEATVPTLEAAYLIMARLTVATDPIAVESLMTGLDLSGADAGLVLGVLSADKLVEEHADGTWCLGRPAATIQLGDIARAWVHHAAPSAPDALRDELAGRWALPGTLAEAAKRWLPDG